MFVLGQQRKRIQVWALLGGAGLILAAFSACAPIYIPNAVNVPLLGQKGELTANASVGTSALDLQGAYAVSDKLGIMFNGSFATAGSDTSESHTFLEAGFGHFKKIGKSGRFECYGGYGWGTAEGESGLNPDIFGSSQARGSYHRLFIQPSIGVATDFFDGAFSLRAVWVNFYKREGFDSTSEIFFEPVLTTKLGFKAFKFTSSAGFPFPCTRRNSRTPTAPSSSTWVSSSRKGNKLT